MKKVLLFACVEKNIGDDLFIYLVAKRYPDVDFVITSEAKYGTISCLSNIIFSDTLRKWLKVSSMQPRNPIKKIYKAIKLYNLTNALGKYDVGVSIVGNAFKNLKYRGKKQIRWIIDRVSITDRFYLLSTNFGPYYDSRWVEDCKYAFLQMQDVCFRDKASYNLFSTLPNVRYAPDAVISLGRKKHIADEYVIISVIDCSFQYRPDTLKNIAKIYENKMAEITEYFCKRGEKVILLCSNADQDQPAAARIKGKISEKNKNNVQVIDYEGNLEEMFSLFSLAKYVVATRFHTIVLSWLYSVPVFPIVYDIKVGGLIDSCGFDNDSVSIHNINELSCKQIEHALECYDFQLSETVIEESRNQFIKLDSILYV